MRLSSWAAGLVLAGTVGAIRFDDFRYQKRQTSSVAPPLPEVPSYNFTMPVDHFSTSDSSTYNNRFFVNDTYYQTGGPVIVFDAGESGFDQSFVAEFLAEYNGTVSATMRLAAELNGLVIGWEHRYYGFSLPVPFDDSTGLPTAGAAGYKYLTNEQALEDLAYFANNFNQTELSQNSNVGSTENLDPYHTPWIMIGGSYPGSRAAWARLRNPEVFYASWASSAPVEVMEDGSSYYNQISRALPSNCTADLHGIAQWVDSELTSGTSDYVKFIQAGVYLMQPQYSSSSDVTAAFSWTAGDVAWTMLSGLVNTPLSYQSFGAGQTLQVFCNYLEQFDVTSYVSARQPLSSSSDIRDVVLVGLQNQGGAAYDSTGIVAANSQDGGEIGFAAFTWAFYNYQQYLSGFQSGIEFAQDTTYYPNRQLDSNSWTWQTLYEMGYFQYANTSAEFLSSEYVTEQLFLTVVESGFTGFSPSDFPSSVDTSGPLKYGGWDMTPSNVMFTNGQYDPWRAFSVASIEYNAPQRTITQDVPKCNSAPSGSDVFGLVYDGAVHVEDLSIHPNFHAASESSSTPLSQGLSLFLEAYNTWAPCFNESRDSVRNAKTSNTNGAVSSKSNSNSNSSAKKTNTGARFGVSGQVWAGVALGLISMVFVSL